MANNKKNDKAHSAVSQKPGKSIPSGQKKHSSLFRLTLLLRPHIGKLLLAILCVVIVNAAEILKPYLSKIVIDDFLVGKETQRGLYSIAGIGIYFVVAIASLLSMTQVACHSSVSKHSQQAAIDTFDKIFMPMRTIDRYELPPYNPLDK